MNNRWRSYGLGLLVLSLLLTGCSGGPESRPPSTRGSVGQWRGIPRSGSMSENPAISLERMGYAVQVGAFSQLDNAVRFEKMLNQRGIDAFYFRHESGLFKVHFGNHTDYHSARIQAENLASLGLIDNYFIVIPDSYSSRQPPGIHQEILRRELVKTVRSFIGVPYRWGGTDEDGGFDCSGLTMVCYRLNGLNLPRVSRSQFQAGRWVARNKLEKGDLVFFATNGGQRVSHVGMYIGNDLFVHAPRTGQTVRTEKLSNPFFSRTYMGGRSYF